MTLLRNRLLSALERGLPGEDAHLDLMPIGRIKSSEALRNAANYRESAVGIYLFEESSVSKGILIQRSEYEGVHGGQIGFPGGKREAIDRDIEDTARRESFEEINMPKEQGQLLAELTSVYIPVSNFLVVPHLFYLDTLPPLKPEPSEVKDIIYFELEELLQVSEIPSMNVRFPNGMRMDVPCFHLAEKQIWGATALMLNELRYLLK